MRVESSSSDSIITRVADLDGAKVKPKKELKQMRKDAASLVEKTYNRATKCREDGNNATSMQFITQANIYLHGFRIVGLIDTEQADNFLLRREQ